MAVAPGEASCGDGKIYARAVPPTHNGRDESLCTCTAIARHVSHQGRQQRRAVYDYRDAGVPKHGVLMLVQQTHQAAKLGALIMIGGGERKERRGVILREVGRR